MQGRTTNQLLKLQTQFANFFLFFKLLSLVTGNGLIIYSNTPYINLCHLFKLKKKKVIHLKHRRISNQVIMLHVFQIELINYDNNNIQSKKIKMKTFYF
jgi:hypothetical protein